LYFSTNSKQSLGKILFQMMLNFKHFLGAIALSSITLAAASAQSPVLIKDIRVGGNSWNNRVEFTPNLFIPMKNNKIFFFAEDKASECVPHLSDGTATGTARIATVFPTLDHYQVYDAVNDRVFFSGAKDVFAAAKADEELYVSDGTAAGTKKLKDIETTGEYGSKPSLLTMINGKVVFKTSAGQVGLWVSDGTEVGTIQLSKLNITTIQAYKNKIYFWGKEGDFGTAKLWITDGTVAGTKLFPITGLTSIENLAFTKNASYVFDSGQLKKIDLNTFATTLIYDTKTNGPINTLFSMNGKEYFSTVKYSWGASTDKNILYETDGTTAGTKIIKEFKNRISSDPYVAETFAVFKTISAIDEEEILLFNGTAAGTIEIDLNEGSGSYAEHFCSAGNRVYFTAGYKTAAKDFGRELMVTDGTVAGTKMVADLVVGSGSGYPRNTAFTKLNGKPTLLFFATIDANGTEPYKMEIPLVTPTQDNITTTSLFTMFPNPSTGNFHILVQDNSSTHFVEISDLQGRVMYQKAFDSNSPITINEAFAKGLYLVKVRDENNVFQVRKLVIQE
jgi:ELWxxDGT repeat protein